MNSNELPITEWWDPEYDVYDVPGSPYDAQPVGATVGDLPEGAFDTWWAAYSHCWDIRWYQYGSAEYRPDFKGRELTRHAYPGQPSTRAQHVVQRCCCTYIRWATSYERYWGIGYSVVATGFHIHPACPHHGHRANSHLIERLWSDPYLNGLLRDPYDMDDDERRGH